MRLDPAEVFGDSVWGFLRRFLIFLSALVLGGALGEVALDFKRGLPDVGDIVDSFTDAPHWAYGWIFTSAAPLVIGLMCVFIISSWSPYWWWVGTVALVSAAVAGRYDGSAGWGWLVWLILVIMVATGVWYLRAWQQNRWAQELMAIEMENQIFRAEAEEEARLAIEQLRREE